jgi:cytochrome c
MRLTILATGVLLAGAAFLSDAADDHGRPGPREEERLPHLPFGRQEEGRAFVQGDRRQVQGKADAEQKLFTHLTTNPKVKVDGKEEPHDSLKTKNDAEVKNVVGWILTR